MTTNTNPSQHYLSWPTASSYLCGANAVGRRNTRTDTDDTLTTCIHCREALRAQREANEEWSD